ncbi:MAG: restriction endonuclease subunit S [Clostridia bacterium]|nr:restriction endonuclease subunit S [Clostridia bacterium]
MTEVCEIIDGDRGKNYPTQEEFFDEGYCLFLNAKNVTKHGFDFSDCMFITKEKDAALRKGKLQRGDVVLTTRGTLGNLAFYAEVVPFENVRINSGMVILRMNRSLTNETFFIEQFRLQLDDIKATIASGSAQPQLPISTMNKIRLVMPELSRQRQFSRFVIQVEKTKSAVQKALDEAQTLFDSLMQKYFG